VATRMASSATSTRKEQVQRDCNCSRADPGAALHGCDLTRHKNAFLITPLQLFACTIVAAHKISSKNTTLREIALYPAMYTTCSR
jgi:hypothetical protein